MRCTAFFGVHRDFIGIHPKTLSKTIFADLVANNLFVIVATLIITSFIWVVKYWCVIFSAEYPPIPQAQAPTFPITHQHSRTCQLVKILTNIPATRHTTRTHTTRAGKDSHSTMIIIIIMICIRLIYIYIYLFCWLFFAFFILLGWGH